MRFNVTIIALASAVLLLTASSAHAQFTAANADTMMNAFNANYYVDDGGGNAHYSAQYSSVSKARPGFWEQAELIEVTEDAASRNSTYLSDVTALLNGFLAQHGTDWTSDQYNDDLMWAATAFVRGYQLTRNSTFLNVAKSNFDAAWARGYDTVNDGMWWNTSDDSKPIAVECPTAVVAYLLGNSLNDSSYKSKSQDILQYIIAHYYNTSTGAVYSYQIGSQSPNPIMPHAQGLFIRAAGLNGFNSQAQLTLAYLSTMGATTSTSNGYYILPAYTDNSVLTSNNAVALRWAAFYVNGHGLQSQYLGWLQANASAAWAVRDTTQNLSWANWIQTTPTGTVLLAWDCMAATDALQVVTPTN
jgi:hypothetical protein